MQKTRPGIPSWRERGPHRASVRAIPDERGLSDRNDIGMETEIKELAVPGFHSTLMPFILRVIGETRPQRVLDFGAGQGALSKRLYDQGLDVSACDMCPEEYRLDKVRCDRADLSEPLPYGDGTFDAVVAAEVAEHIVDHDSFFRECSRVLASGGHLVITTPNILSLKSRLRFLTSGFLYSFGPLHPDGRAGMQHISSRTPDQYGFLASRHGLSLETVAIDKYQKSSAALLALWPALWLLSLVIGPGSRKHNSLDLLLGRKVILVFRKATNG